jgi:transketolase
MSDRTQLWNDLAAQLAVDSIRCTTAAASGHPTSSMSAAHLTAVLFADHLRTHVSDPKDPANDRFVLSKGHAAPLLYSTLKAIGAISDDDLLSLRRFGSPIQGHPVPLPEVPWIDVATGSLGQGLPIGLGMAFSMRLRGSPGRAWVMIGDSEMAEGSVWEAMEAASYHGVTALTAIVDLNKLGQRGPTMHGWHADVFRDRASAFGWLPIVIDGHDVTAIDAAYSEARNAGRPTMVIARTEKGHGVSFLANAEGWHGKALSKEEAVKAIEELGGERHLSIEPPKPGSFAPLEPSVSNVDQAPAYDEPVATRKAFGDSLAWLAGHRSDIVVLDGEVGNSTYTDEFQKVAPERFFEMYIAEQAMIGAQVGLQALGETAFSATFGAFLTRATDFIRMGAIGRADLRLCGSHAGVSIGEDGPSQMALEDLSTMRALHGSTVLYPADGNATVKLVSAMCDLPGISYIRTTREATRSLYPPGEDFPVGGSKTLASSAEDRVTLVGAGVTLHECVRAAGTLASGGIVARVIDCYSVKPIDGDTIRRALEETRLIVVVEDHRVEGGLGDAVLDAVAAGGALTGEVIKIGVADMPGSGKPEELRAWAGIDAASIAERVRNALS